MSVLKYCFKETSLKWVCSFPRTDVVSFARRGAGFAIRKTENVWSCSLFRVVLDKGGGGVPDTTRWGGHAPAPHGRFDPIYSFFLIDVYILFV